MSELIWKPISTVPLNQRAWAMTPSMQVPAAIYTATPADLADAKSKYTHWMEPIYLFPETPDEAFDRLKKEYGATELVGNTYGDQSFWFSEGVRWGRENPKEGA